MSVPTLHADAGIYDVIAVTTSSGLTSWSILTATAGLVAFHIGVFTLVGRERKSPYVINAVFPVLLLCLSTAAIACLSSVLPTWWKAWGLVISVVLLVAAFVWSISVIAKVSVRFIYFVEAVKPHDVWLLRRWRLRRQLGNLAPTYSHDANPIPADLKTSIIEILNGTSDAKLQVREHLDPLSLAVLTEHQGQANRIFAELAHVFLKAGFTVQYLTASRHPIEFLAYLAEHIGRDKGQDGTNSGSKALKKYREKIVVIDAYSSHFAFLDSIYPRKDREVESLGISLIPSKATYAGMHSAGSRAFKTIRSKTHGDQRNPTLVIYEDCHALSDLESPEQYRIFVRHVMPSERMWGGMFTVFAESMQPEADWRVLQSYASMKLDYREDVVREKSPPPRAGEREAQRSA